ncbi:aminoglycoside N(3)-acetyltransferase [Petrotoga sp. 9PWA.NaAc.5.4]|uniref:aminoglycoside N(3)-acetyltransferase n=1 Tax=Petrotoga sp. 9PWA.NaAc.5.4 TaxID=1434328 RepID=UPI000EFAC725|nr:AAC(3) family N-acetyltransferase [Petrotoga sp. 9PWA.NaAc.5.4]
MIITITNLLNTFESLGIREGDTLLVHSSLSSFGYVEGGVQTVIEALLASVGTSGNVFVPTLTGKPNDGPTNPPVFDVRNSPCWTGRISSDFMKLPQAKRSLHPTHSVAGIGPLVDYLIKGHEDSLTPCGKDSPYIKMAEIGSYILLLGVTMDSNTTIHSVEELANLPYHLQKEKTECAIIDYDGNILKRRLYLHQWGTPRYFQKIEEPLENLHILTQTKCGNSVIRLIKSMPMIEWLYKKLIKNPEYLIKES